MLWAWLVVFQENMTLLKAHPKSKNAVGVACCVSGEYDPVEGAPKVKKCYIRKTLGMTQFVKVGL